MKLYAAGVDFKDTALEIREGFAFDDKKAEAAIKNICKSDLIGGCVILSTCGRSEIYIASETKLEPKEIFLKAVSAEDFTGKINVYYDKEVVYHIMETTCGLNSAIKGESQIISQVSKSAELSRGLGLIGSELDVLFRTAVKTARHALREGTDQNRLTSAHKAIERLEKELGGLKGKKCLVIGNGNVGLLAARLLVEKRADVTITLRSYRHGESIVPAGCGVIAYKDRLKSLSESDIVISATKSPHFTITRKMTEGLTLPSFIVDLAMPRDIDPSILTVGNIKYYNIDDFAAAEPVPPETTEIIEQGVREYLSWYGYRESLGIIEEIKEYISRRISISESMDKNNLETVVGKSVDILLGGIKESIDRELLENALKKIKRRSRL